MTPLREDLDDLEAAQAANILILATFFGRLTISHPANPGEFRLYVCGLKISCNTALNSSRARAQSPAKLEPCMMASVLGFKSASLFRLWLVSVVQGTYSAKIPA